MAGEMDGKIKSFSIGYRDERDSDESKYASLVSDLVQSEHYPYYFDAKEFFENLAVLTFQSDEPIAHHSAIPLYLLSRYAKMNGVTVLVSGEGGDELFAGYGNYSALIRDLKISPVLPDRIWALSARMLDLLRLQKLARVSRRFSKSPRGIAAAHSGVSDNQEMSYLFESNFKKSFVSIEDLLAENNQDPFSDLLFAWQKTNLESLLMKQDKMSMFASVETRVPFLDSNIVQFANRLPNHYKIQNGTTKYLLKKLGIRYLPSTIIQRKKLGFPVPVAKWLRNNRKYVDILLEKRTRERGFFRQGYVESLHKTFLAGDNRRNNQVWRILSLEIWLRIFVEKTPVDDFKVYYS